MEFLKKYRSLLGFALVGLISTILDVGVLKLGLWLGLNTYLATALGFLTGLTNGYLLNSRYVFEQERQMTAYGKYFIISAGGLLLTEGIIHVLSQSTGLMSVLAAKLVAVVIVFFWNYILSKMWAFKASPLSGP